MAIGNTPQNQLDALPLQTAVQAAEAGSLEVVGGAIARVFSSATLGIAGSSVQTVNTKVCLVTPYLDLRGTSKYAMQLRTTNAVGARAALPACVLEAQYRMGPNDTPSASYVNGGAISEALNAVAPHTGTVTFAATTGANEQQTGLWAWGFNTPAGTITNVCVLGSDVRFIFSFSTNPVAAANIFSAYLWASS